MAMLSNVKVIDMVNGKATKIELYGDKYTMVDDGTANVGDIMLSLIDTRDITKGAYYEVADTGYREVHEYTFFDDVEDEAHFFGGQAVVFRKEEVAEADTSGFSEIDVEDAMVGDFVKFTGVVPDYITKGKLYKIEEIDGAGDPQVRDDDGDMFDTDMEDFVVLRKDAEEILTYNGKQYENIGEVEAKPGDLVVFHADHFHNTTGGKPYEVTGDDQFVSDHGRKLFTKGWGGKEKRDVYRLIETKQAEPELEVGDIVVITGEEARQSRGCRNEVGDIGKIVEYEVAEGAYKVDVPGRPDYANYTDKSEVRRATDEEARKYREAAAVHEASKFKAGDIARVVSSPCGSPEGSLVEITSVSGDSIIAEGVATFTHKIMKYVYCPHHLEYVASK